MPDPVLPGAPWLIAHRSMLGINRPYKVTLNHQDYVLWQSENGEVNALNNICPHMQAPLSNGWVCAERNTIACPFHALEFDGRGYLHRDGQPQSQPITQTLPLIVVGDLIWTYGNCEARLPIPDLLLRLTQGFEFVGVAGEKSIQGSFLDNLLISYDYNHQNGTHRELFRIKTVEVHDYVEAGYTATVSQGMIRDENTWIELFQNPVLALMPKTFNNRLEYAFPCLTGFVAKIPAGEIIQLHVLYPEGDSTKTFVMVFAKIANPLLKRTLKRSLLKTVDKVVQQDTATIEALYPRQKPKIRLPNEEIMAHAEKLYREW
jgi:nitrite reductase/ring-hydroxylating ferredoxin subunit